jgi:hypothetical protein
MDTEIAFVYAGPDICTDIHHRPLRGVCQMNLAKFYGFFRVLRVFVPLLVHFVGKFGAGSHEKAKCGVFPLPLRRLRIQSA